MGSGRGRIFRHFTSGAFWIHLRKIPKKSGFVVFWFGKMAILGPNTSKFQKIRLFRPVFFLNFPDHSPNPSGTFTEYPQHISGKCPFLHHSRRSRRRYDPWAQAFTFCTILTPRTTSFNLRLFFRKMKKSEIFRKFLKTNPEKFRKELGDIPENSGILRGLFRNSPEGYWAQSCKLQKNFSQYPGVSGKGSFLSTGSSQ